MTLIWTDIETTGLDENKGYILELGLIETSDTLEILSEVSYLIKPDESLEAIKERCSTVVRQTHTESGLWEALEDPNSETLTLSEAENAAKSWLEERTADQPAPMCGSTVSFDRRWIRSHMPDLNSAFHYRNIDVSSIKEVYRRLVGEPPTFLLNKKHRAIDDLHYSIEELRFYLESMGWLDA